MNRLIIIVLVIISPGIRAQDLITTKDGITFEVRIIKTEKKIIYYNLFDDPGKELLSMEKRDIKKINYENPPKKANGILITDKLLSGEDLMIGIFQYLIKSGYEIQDFSNKDLVVNTEYLGDHRITVEISDNNALFVFYYQFITGNTYNNPTNDHYVYGKKENPGEYRGDSSNGPFKDFDALCRNYLMTNKGSFKYIKE